MEQVAHQTPELPAADSRAVSPQPYLYQKELQALTANTGQQAINFSSSDGYSHDDIVKTDNPDWMSKLADSIRLSDVSIPATHDTMSFYGGDIVQTQAMSLANQLQSGIRGLDIRCRHIEDVFAIHHGPVFQKTFFGDVLNILVAYLTLHPTETVYMRVQEEYDPENITRTFAQTFKIGYWESYKASFWDPATSSNPSNPPLGETRGKIVVLQNFSSSTNYGVPWSSFSIQDDYTLNSNWDLYDKWERVQAQLGAANSGSADIKYANFLSGAVGSFPYFVASGKSSPQTDAPRLMTGLTTPGWNSKWPDFPRVNCFLGICSIAFEGTNNLTSERLGSDYKTRTGILFTDFPGPGLISGIIALNS